MSVSVPAAYRRQLERLAEAKRVSVAWVIRDAVEQYLRSEAPLFEVDEIDSGFASAEVENEEAGNV